MSTTTRLTRRRFLMAAGGAIGATALACSGLMALGNQPVPVQYIESSCGKEQNVGNKILVAYASVCGSTGEVAATIGQELCAAGATTDVRLVKDVRDLSPYRAVVLGSAIRAGRWLPDAVKFVETHQARLSQMPVAYFVVCLTMKDDTPQNRQTVAAYLDPVRAKVKPVSEGLFAGVLDMRKLALIPRLIMQSMKSPEGDFRNWQVIRTWASELRPSLSA
jgi:menaquinone-dependent protoporphyrinogen oxidase